MIVNLPALRILQIGDRGNLATERVHIEALRECDLGYYLLVATVEIAPGRVYAGLRPAFWFSSQQVRAGDHIIVYTRQGMPSTEFRDDGHMNYFYYWGATMAFFGPIPTARAVLAELNMWQTA